MHADCWVDPSCPYTWVTACRLEEVERVRDVRVRWHVMSLPVLDEGREVDPEGDPEGWLWQPVRLAATPGFHELEGGPPAPPRT